MKHRIEIDLNKMSEQSRLYYLQDLLMDLAEGLQDLSGTKPRYDYIQHLIEHAAQASEDIRVLLSEKVTLWKTGKRSYLQLFSLSLLN